MKVEQYDTVLLKDGRIAAIVEKFSDTAFMADIGDYPEEWDTIDITINDIERVLHREK